MIKNFVKITGFIFYTCAFLSISSCQADTLTGKRVPNSHEMFYRYAAVTVYAPEICEKISPQAYITAGWGGDGQQISLVRSECYFDVARRFARKDLCKNVVPISTAALDGSYYSPSRCRAEIAKNGPDDSYSVELPADKDLLEIFSQMGYDPSIVINQNLIPNPLNLFDIYAQLGQKKDILTKIHQFLESSKVNNLPLEQKEMIYDLAAHVTNDIQWCQKIRADAPYPDSHYFKNTSHEYFRDTCIMQIAYNLKNASLCAEMPQRPADRYHIITLKQNCSGQLTHPEYISSHYEYMIPEDEKIIASLLNTLDYPLPSWNKVPPGQIMDTYHKFLLGLTKYPADKYPTNENPNYEKSRNAFIGRVKTLPDFK